MNSSDRLLNDSDSLLMFLRGVDYCNHVLVQYVRDDIYWMDYIGYSQN